MRIVISSLAIAYVILIFRIYYIMGMEKINSGVKHILWKFISCLDASADLYTGTIGFLLDLFLACILSEMSSGLNVDLYLWS